jgi:hypothetical protein
MLHVGEIHDDARLAVVAALPLKAQPLRERAGGLGSDAQAIGEFGVGEVSIICSVREVTGRASRRGWGPKPRAARSGGHLVVTSRSRACAAAVDEV